MIARLPARRWRARGARDAGRETATRRGVSRQAERPCGLKAAAAHELLQRVRAAFEGPHKFPFPRCATPLPAAEICRARAAATWQSGRQGNMNGAPAEAAAAAAAAPWMRGKLHPRDSRGERAAPRSAWRGCTAVVGSNHWARRAAAAAGSYQLGPALNLAAVGRGRTVSAGVPNLPRCRPCGAAPLQVPLYQEASVACFPLFEPAARSIRRPTPRRSQEVDRGGFRFVGGSFSQRNSTAALTKAGADSHIPLPPPPLPSPPPPQPPRQKPRWLQRKVQAAAKDG